MAWNFYQENATAFVREFGLMPGRIARAGLGSAANDVFVARLGLIHATVLEARARSEAEAAEKGMR